MAHSISESDVQQVLDLLPANCFVRQYCDFARTQVSSPLAFHLGIALSLVAVWSPRDLVGGGPGWKADTFSNVYVLCVGPSGKAEKGLAVTIAHKLIGLVSPDLMGGDPTAYESLMTGLQAEPKRIYLYPELAPFLTLTGTGDPRGQRIKDGFLQSYDGLTFKATYTKGEKEVRDPRPTFLGACTPIHLETCTSAIDWQGGFLSRFLFFYALPEREVESPHPRPDTELWLRQWGAWSIGFPNAGKCRGYTSEARTYLRAWRASLEARFGYLADDIRLAGVYSRVQLMVSKIVTLLAWSSGKAASDWTADERDVYVAVLIAEMSFRSALALSAGIAENNEMREQRRVLAAINGHPRPLGEITRVAALTKRRTIPYLETLIEQGEITGIPIDATMHYWRTIPGGSGGDPGE